MILTAFLNVQTIYAQAPRTPNSDITHRQGAAATASAYDAVALSMSIWGLGLAAGIALVASLIPQSKGNGSNGHNHGHS